MKLTNEGIRDKALWESKGYHLPAYDRAAMIEKTKAHPTWIHFGAGNIFRALHAAAAQRMLEQGDADTGLIVAEGFDYEIIEKQYRPQDDLSVFVNLKSSGQVEKSVIGSIAESCILDSGRAEEFGRLREIFRNPSLQMATFTITEKGYRLTDPAGKTPADIASDYAEGPAAPKSYLGKVAALLYARFEAGQLPIAMVSTDNCSRNGEKLYAAMTAFADRWAENGKAPAGFASYVKDPSRVSFPWSMIDKITPRPDPSVQEMLLADGLEGVTPVETSKHTFIAPFVNAEETEYLVIEDSFPAGRPALEKAGFLFTDQETVGKVETMKVTTCLNPLHTSLAIYGCLLGYTKISEEMKDEQLKNLILGVGYREGLPVVVNPGVLDPKEFIDTVVGVRLPNPFMPDTPQRIACDTSQKLPIRFGETVKKYRDRSELSVGDLKLIPLVFAGWLRYLMAVDDEGNAFELSPDPLLERVCPYVAGLKIGEVPEAAALKEQVLPLLKDETIFGCDLDAIGMADTVVAYFAELLAGKGAVRATLRKYC
ncbi:MAG: mannitol dehydrogenase family protein [Lachnospiraceae bacterium]|nr:mannitol dehydrogenase family protein [Lachnospiraceae bacterium]